MQKKTYLPSFIFLFTLFSIFSSCKTHERKLEKENESEDRYDDIKGAMDYEFNMLKNPATGKIPEGIREQELLQANQIMRTQNVLSPLLNNNYVFEGPDNLGGRTRAIVYDVRFNGSTNQVILAGGVSGGIYKSTDNGTTWLRKSPTGEHYSVTSIAQDPRAGFQDTWYYTTGEAIGNSASGTGSLYSGNGVYKSTDNGETWVRQTTSNNTPLETFTVPNDFMSKVVVNPINGHVYVACCASVIRTTTGGAAWQTLLSGTLNNSGQFTDVAVTPTGRVYVAFGGTNSAAVDGVWTSANGNAGTYTRIATGGTPATWNTNNTYGRIVLAIAPSNENLVYALYWNGYISNCSAPAPEAKLFLWDNSVSTWTDKSANLPDEAGCSSGNDPFAVQSGYCMTISVKPDNANVVFISGTNLYRSTDGFASTANISRVAGYANTSGYFLYLNSHSDVHAVAFQPGNTSVMLCADDGGIQRTVNDLASPVAWSQINNGYRTFQYYYVTVDPRNGNNKVMGGAQDNGTTRNIGGSGSSFEQVFSGDGASVGISKSIGGFIWEYFTTQYGKIFTKAETDPNGLAFDITPITASNTGLFVTLFWLDPDNTENLYYADNNSLYRTSSASTVDGTTWTQLTGFETPVGISNDITALATTRGNYNAAKASLFAGTSNGKLFRYDDPINAAASAEPADITGAGFPAGGYISSIAVNPRNDDTVLVTFSNYSITSVFWTGNANAATPTWQNVEGNLTLPSYRSSAILIKNNIAEYYVGTSAGLYGTAIDGANPSATTWAQEGASSIGNAVVTSLALRTSDNKMAIGTHGYGMWSSVVGTVLPVKLFDFRGQLNNNSALLYWSTAFESNSSEFQVEKSTDGIIFNKIGRVPASGNSSYTKNYNYTDNNITGVNYYRLKMVDLDGRSEYSKIIVISNFNKSQVSLFPNPASSFITITGIHSNGLITITNMNGIQLQQIKSTGSNETLDLSRLNIGTYIITYSYQNERQQLKFVKQ